METTQDKGKKPVEFDTSFCESEKSRRNREKGIRDMHAERKRQLARAAKWDERYIRLNDLCTEELMVYVWDYVYDGKVPGEVERDRLKTKERLCLVCKISRQTLEKWAKEPKTPIQRMFRDAIEMLEQQQTVTCLNMHPDPRKDEKGPNETVAKRILNRAGYPDRVEQDVHQTGEVRLNLVDFKDAKSKGFNDDGSPRK